MGSHHGALQPRPRAVRRPHPRGRHLPPHVRCPEQQAGGCGVLLAGVALANQCSNVGNSQLFRPAPETQLCATSLPSARSNRPAWSAIHRVVSCRHACFVGPPSSLFSCCCVLGWFLKVTCSLPVLRAGDGGGAGAGKAGVLRGDVRPGQGGHRPGAGGGGGGGGGVHPTVPGAVPRRGPVPERRGRELPPAGLRGDTLRCTPTLFA